MTIYPAEHKASLIERMLPPQNANVPQLSNETGIPKDTLYDWRRQARRARGLSPTRAVSGERWSAEEKFAMVVETAALNEAECGAYCRQRGLYPEQLQAWRRACEQANVGKAAPPPKHDGHAAKRRIQALERELRRKDKALAEAAALLVLRKKADAILKARTRTLDQPPGSPANGSADRGGPSGGGAVEARVSGTGYRRAHLSALEAGRRTQDRCSP